MAIIIDMPKLSDTMTVGTLVRWLKNEGDAIESGDVVLMSGDLRGIVNATALSKRTHRTIIGNFVWAYGYNVALIPVAAGVLYPFIGVLLSPMLAAAAMSVSSVFVLTNSLRLRRFTPDPGNATPRPNEAVHRA